MNREIFLSYAREDASMAQLIADALADEGFHVWWDRHIEGGTIWPDELDRRLNSVAAVVVVWSADAVESDFVLAEAEAGWLRRILVPVLVEVCEIPEPFGEIHAIDLSAWQGGRGYGPFRKLVASIEKQYELEDGLDNIGAHRHDLELLYDELDSEELLQQAKAGDPEAQLSVDIAYQNGIGDFKEDAQEALRWMTLAARQGHENAYSALGWLHYNGFLPQRDVYEALKWFLRAAKAGDAGAAWQISQIYAEGDEGVRKNLKLARRYCEWAADMGDEDAIEMLDELYG